MSENSTLDGVAFTVDDEPAQNRKKLMLLIGAGLVLALLAVKFLLLGGSGDTATPVLVGAPKARPAASAPTASPTPVAVVPASFTDAVGVDPFKPLAQEPVVAPPAPPPPPPSPSPTPVATQAPPTVVVLTAPSAGPQTITFKAFEADGSAHVTVNSVVYEVAAGQTFADRFKFNTKNAAKPACGDFLYGESTFTLCAGEQRTFG